MVSGLVVRKRKNRGYQPPHDDEHEPDYDAFRPFRFSSYLRLKRTFLSVTQGAHDAKDSTQHLTDGKTCS